MKCEEARGLFFLYVDSELDPRSVQEVNLHLETCSRCRERWSFETKLEESIVSAASMGVTRGDFDGAELDARLRAAVERGRADSLPFGARQRRRRAFVLGAAAALLLAALGAWVWLASTPVGQSIARSAVVHHEKYVAGKSPIQVAGPSASVADFFAGELNFPVRVPETDSLRTLVGARRCSFIGEPVAYVAYEVAGQPVTVILGPRRSPEALMDAITLAPEGILEENIRTHSAIFSTVHGVLFGAVGETSPADLHGLLRAFRTDPRSPSRILPETPGGTLRRR